MNTDPKLTKSNKEVYAQFKPDASTRYDIAAFGWTVCFYASYIAYAQELLPWWAFATLGTIAIVRNFNALHEAFHAIDPKEGLSLTKTRLLPIVLAPWQLGYDELRKNHRLHHTHEGGPEDPDRYLIQGSALIALLQAFTQPEQSVVRHIKRHGLRPKLALTLVWHALIWVGLLLSTPLEAFLLYNAVARYGNTAAWWIFDHWLHRPGLYHRLQALPLPKPLVALWALLFSSPNIKGVLHHYLHHKYPFVPDRELPKLAEFVQPLAKTK